METTSEGSANARLLSSRDTGNGEVLFQYKALMRLLHGKNFTITAKVLEGLLLSLNEIIVLVEANDQFVGDKRIIVSTAQASLILTPPRPHVMINNVVTLKDYRGLGYGQMAMRKLEESVRSNWLHNNIIAPEIEIMLTNSPKRKNGRFYAKLGFCARTWRNNNPTLVWQKVLNAEEN